MKCIMTHDIDHITVWEHKFDLVVPKFLLRNLLELCSKKISFWEFSLRIKQLSRNKWHNLEELMKFDRDHGIPAAFFIGVNKGLGLSYPLNYSRYWGTRILEHGFSLGLHGICYADMPGIERERKTFKMLFSVEPEGVRMHYLRTHDYTLKFLAAAGYRYDSSIMKLSRPYRTEDGIFEFPLTIMDGYIINRNHRWQVVNLDGAISETKKIIEEALAKKIGYITILFHDRYFSDAFLTWKRWYIWLVNYLKDRKFRFVSYDEAIEELSQGK